MRREDVSDDVFEEVSSKSIELTGLAASLLSREWGEDPTWVEFSLAPQSRPYLVVIEDHRDWRLKHDMEPPPAHERYRALVAVRRQHAAERASFLPLRQRKHGSLDAAIVATIYATLRRGDWSADEWRHELAAAEREDRRLTAAEQWDSERSFFAQQIRSRIHFLEQTPDEAPSLFVRS